ncbi:hypothetical protein CAEBREN_14186 [Caenorhabditis brenneri]|uniref:DUF19 domain-containing protein n=1 Tax=Caenorhabditis brenneri TaxID=135651 RepID=G0MAL8_CAEBE|nr:hypothetical protein CAEBREN_14186 [Caenorhabditis brenneri]
MKHFMIFAVFLLPIVNGFMLSDCYEKVLVPCKTKHENVLKFMNEMTSELPPLTDAVNKQEKTCRDVMRDGVINKTVFFESKSCLLSIAKEKCIPEDFAFFYGNYDELMGLYTKKPENDFCDSAYDKFYKMQCKQMESGIKKSMKNLNALSWADSDVKELVRGLKDYQKCAEKSCEFYEKEKKESEVLADALENIEIDMKTTFEQYPHLLKYKCMETGSFAHIASGYYACKIDEQKKNKNCVKSAIASFCQKDVIAEFEDM